MSYDINFKVAVAGREDTYVRVGYCEANITYNLREMIVKSTGLKWENCENNGLCKDIIPYIAKGYAELTQHPEKYKQYESPNGWGTLHGCKQFFLRIMNDWDAFCEDYSTRDLVDVTYFFIE